MRKSFRAFGFKLPGGRCLIIIGTEGAVGVVRQWASFGLMRGSQQGAVGHWCVVYVACSSSAFGLSRSHLRAKPFNLSDVCAITLAAARARRLSSSVSIIN